MLFQLKNNFHQLGSFPLLRCHSFSGRSTKNVHHLASRRSDEEHLSPGIPCQAPRLSWSVQCLQQSSIISGEDVHPISFIVAHKYPIGCICRNPRREDHPSAEPCEISLLIERVDETLFRAGRYDDGLSDRRDGDPSWSTHGM